MAQVLRDYQRRGLDQVLAAYKKGARSVLMTLPTGGGKTTVFASLASDIDQPVVVLVHRRELATQAANRFRENGIDFGFVMAGEKPRPWARVQIASVQTLIRRQVPPAALVICDEAHLSTADTWSRILSQYPKSRILGCTATPWRLGGKPLIGAYDASVVVATPAELRAGGYLCEYHGFSYKTPDLSAVATTGGDYNEKQSAEAMRSPGIVDNVVEQWQRYASHLSTVVFNVTVEHSIEVTAKFKAAGVRAEHLDGKTTIEQRRAILKRVASGETQVLCNVGVAVEGLDIPRLKCCVLNRPTKSLARAIQMMGRVRRPWQGQSARIHDHAFLIKQHGLPDQDRDYSLHAKDLDGIAPPSLTQCDQCFALYEGAVCPSCSHENEVKPRGEAEIAKVADAEQFDFASSAEPARMVAPVRIEWSRQKIGKSIEGVYYRKVDEQQPYGKRNLYQLRGKTRDYTLPGTAMLDSLMTKVQINDTVRVTYNGEKQLPGGRVRKEFRVEKDEEPAPEREALIERMIALYTKEHLSFQKIADATGFKHAASVRGYLLSAGVRLRKGFAKGSPWEPKNPDGFKKRYLAGEPLSTLTKDAKIGRDGFRAWVKRCGMPVRPEGTPRLIATKLFRDAVSRFKAGDSVSKISADIGISEVVIRREIRAAGLNLRSASEARNILERKRAATDAPLVKQAIRLYRKGTSAEQIAQKMGRSSTWVLRHLRKNGCVIRSLAETWRLANR